MPPWIGLELAASLLLAHDDSESFVGYHECTFRQPRHTLDEAGLEVRSTFDKVLAVVANWTWLRVICAAKWPGSLQFKLCHSAAPTSPLRVLLKRFDSRSLF